MRAVLQRVRRASVSVANERKAEIDHGLVVLLGIGQDDGREQAAWLAEKTAVLRIFEDHEGKSNLSLLDIGGQAIVVSQFTLYADSSKGRRPSFVRAAQPDLAEPLVGYFAKHLETQGVPVQMGFFGAHMVVEIENDGPVTIILEK